MMKKTIFVLGVLLALTGGIGFVREAHGQEQELPRLAVVQFDTNATDQKVRQDAVTVRNLVESQMVAAQKYQVITRTDIDRLLANQQIQVSSISSAENIRKLQLQNISYIVTGSVDALGGDYAVTLRILDVSTGRFSHSANAFMGSASQALYNGITQLAGAFAGGMTSRDGQVAQVTQTTPSSGNYKVGDFGPAGGWVFYDKGRVTNGWRYLEAAPPEADFTAPWGAYEKNVSGTATAVGTGKRNTQVIVEYLRGIGESGRAAQLCDSLGMDGYDDWFLPSKDELNLMYQNLKQKGLGEFSASEYWSSSENNNVWVQRFSDGYQGYYSKANALSVRAVRAF